MTDMVDLQDIMNLARQESARLYHYFIGVEHLFIGLTKLNGGLTNAVLERHGLSPRFVRYSIRETVGRYENRRHWPGFPETPRVIQVMNLAAQHARGDQITEHDLLLAIFDENDNVVIRVLQEMGADIATLRATAANWTTPLQTQRPAATIVGGADLETEERQVILDMFHDYSQVEIMRDLDGGYSGARVLLVRPIRPGGQRDAPVVVKLDDRHSILYERRRYDQYVKGTLPASAARLLDAPVVPDDTWCGGLKYTFVGNLEDSEPLSLRHLADRRDPQQLSSFLRALYDVFGPAWWLQNQPYRFGVWREYEHVLPSALVVDSLPEAKLGAAGQVLTPLGTWSRGSYVLPGEVVALNGFVVQKVDAENDVLHLAAGAQPEAINRSGKVEVRGLGLHRGTYFRGEVVDMLIGRVANTRDDLLRRALLLLEPDFDLRTEWISSGHSSVSDLPNPIRRVNRLLEQQVHGYVSTIHGDLHVSNVLVGPRGDPWLIDFAWTREGHTLFDWALLEVSLLVEAISQVAPAGWPGRWQIVALLNAINQGDERLLRDSSPLTQSLQVVRTIREIVARCLVVPDKWAEYYVALALLALRAMEWRSAGKDGRRLAFLIAALSVAAAQVSEDIPTAADPTTFHGPGNEPTLDQSGLFD